jgi:protein ImuA
LSTPSNDIIQKLRQDLLKIEGYKAPETGAPDIPIGPLADAFPNHRFPTGKLHEFIAPTPQKAAASGGFIACLTGALLEKGGDCIWLIKKRRVFPPALSVFGVPPHRVVFCKTPNEKHLLWVAEEALQCKGVVAVVAEVADLSYIASLRLQLSIEDSRVTGFLLRQSAKNLQPIACAARWRISPACSRSPVPCLTRVSYYRWTVELEKVKNGRPGIWQLEWSAGRLQSIAPDKKALPVTASRVKTG